MKHTRNLSIVVLAFWLSVAALSAQTDTEQILAIRNASNQALKAYDNEKVLSYLTADALTTTGNGTLLSNKNALKEYILEGDIFQVVLGVFDQVAGGEQELLARGHL